MKISLNWLSNFIDITEKNNDKIKEIITARSAEIETMEDTGAHLDKVVLGKIDKILPHPNADKLRITMVDNGQEKIQVVCGGSNLEEGMKVAFAQLGAVVKWHGTDVVKMEKAKIRGEESFGMICAAEEIGLDEMFPKKGEHEIVDLSHINAPTGTPLAKALGLDDVVIDVDNHAITNRPDLFSHRGFAREFVACGLGKWKNDSSTTDQERTKNGSPLPIEIKIKDKDACSNYLAVYLTGIEVKDSPDWMKQHLIACGIRPISNIVDITNYVMLELGMPMHAFDLDQVKGKKWTMRKSKKGEKVITLDEKEIELFEGITVFDDGNELFDLCGIMGGLHSGINQKTNRVLLHAPVYNPELTRRGVRGLGQISDAAIIYEKGVDNELAKEGLSRSMELILELCPNAKIASEVVEFKNYKSENRSIELRKSQMERLIGYNIPDKEVKRILNDLGFELKENKECFEVIIPSWRLGDIHMEADLIEEVVRIYGYDEIPFVAPKISNKPVAINARRRFEKEMKDKLVSFGFNEIYTFSFLGPELLKKCGMEQGSASIEVTNPISSELSIMRESLLPWTMEMIADNTRYQKEFKLFELARTYHKKADKAEEESNLIITTVGSDFRELQGTIEHLGFKLKPSNEKNSESHQHPGRIADIILRGQTIGSLYELHPQIGKNFGIKERVTIAEINMESIHAMNIDQTPKYKELPKYPSIQLDVSVLIPKKNLAQDYTNAIQKTDKTLVKNIDLIDEYEGENIGADKRSLTYSITYRADDRTLKEEEVSEIHKKVLANLKSTGAAIRD
ncbi:phenylalanine--tRNA ligase subunit beta [Candidatus Pacearchaeota archaeon]|nr:phenylalanine--tRNA ligase subunit beta [Candidatus Pacearchaeota archaeon]